MLIWSGDSRNPHVNQELTCKPSCQWELWYSWWACFRTGTASGMQMELLLMLESLASLASNRGQAFEQKFFCLKLFGHPRISRQNPRISRKKVWSLWVSKDIPNFLAPTLSRARPHILNISGPKSLGLGSLFFPDLNPGWEHLRQTKLLVGWQFWIFSVVANVCGDPLLRYTCRNRFPQNPGVFQWAQEPFLASKIL